MFSLSCAILLVGVWAGNTMRDANTLEKGTKGLVFTTPVCLYGMNLFVKLSFNKNLEISEALKNFRFFPQQVNPNKFSMIINKRHIIVVVTNRSGGRTPYITENKVKSTIRDGG